MSSRNICSVPTCIQDPKDACFVLPKDHKRARYWMEICGIEKNYADITAVCEAHFHKALINHKVHPKRLANGAVPTLNLPDLNNRKHNTRNINNTSNTIPDLEIPSNSKTNAETSYKVNYSNFMGNIITKSLNAPSSQPNPPTDTSILDQSTDMEPSNIVSMEVEPSSTEIIRERSEDSEKVIIKVTVIQAVEPSTTNIEKSDSKNSDGGTSSKSTFTNSKYAARTIPELQNKIKFISKVPNTLKLLAVKIYLKCPQGYEMLNRTLKLPSLPECKTVLNGCTISTDNDTLFTSILQYKSELMSMKQKDCVLCIGTIEASKNLYYDIKRDKLVGVHDINNIQKPEPAYKVLILTMQGLYADWQQTIDIAYLSTPKEYNLENIDRWVLRHISNLSRIGYKVRALVCETDHLLLSTATYQEKPRKVYCIYDFMSLLKWFFYIFLTHDYIIEGATATIQHIFDYFKMDSRNKPRLSPKLTEDILKPASIQDVNPMDIMKVINKETAAAMTTYINLKVLDPEAKNTVDMITKMSMFIEVLFPNKFDNAQKDRSERVISVLYDMTFFFLSFKVVNNATKKEVPLEDTFVPKFKLTIKAILMLYKDNIMDPNDNTKFISMKRLSLENMRSFLDRIKQHKKDDTKPKCKKVYLAFIQSALRNVLKPIHDKKPEINLEANLNEINNIVMNFKGDPVAPNIHSDITIKCSEYNALDFKNKDAIVLLAGFILKKCYDRHSDCDDMKNYIFIVLQDTNSICKTILREIQESVCVVPQESFIEFIEIMEIKFRSFITKNILEISNGFIKSLLKAVESVTFPMPCSCFPMLYAKKLYLRVRIYDMLIYNNSCLTRCPDQYLHLIVNNS